MNERIFAYCERGRDIAFWAEPWNAASNASFLLAALMAACVWGAQVPSRRGWTELALILLVAVIGIGSFMFHTFATRWAAIADTGPIAIFMLAYVVYALLRFLDASIGWAMGGLAVFLALLASAAALPCPMALRGLVSGGACLNGSIGYVPALLMLIAVGAAASARRNRAGPYLLSAAAVFAASLTARSLDFELCGAASSLFGRPRGTHALWHVLNAVTLGLLLLAAVRHGRAVRT